MADQKLTKVQLTELSKIKPNKMIISFGYDNKVVVPIEQGLTIIKSLEFAEEYKEVYDKDSTIIPLTKDFNARLLNHQEYIDIKTAMLLKIPLNDVKEQLHV